MKMKLLYSSLFAVAALQINSAQAQQYSIPTIPPPGTFEKTEYQGTPIGVLAEQFFVEDGWQVSEIYRQERSAQNLTYMKVSMCSYNDSGSSYNASGTSKAYYTDEWKNQFETWKQAHLARGAIFTPSNNKEGYLNFEKRYGLTWKSDSNTCQQLRDLIFAHFESKNASSQSSFSTSSSVSFDSVENVDEANASSSTDSSVASYLSSSSSSTSSYSSYSALSASFSSSSSVSTKASSSSSSAKTVDGSASITSSFQSSSSIKTEKTVEPIIKEQEQTINARPTTERDLQFFKDNADKPNVLTGVCRRLRNRTSWFAVKVRERCIERALRWGLNP